MGTNEIGEIFMKGLRENTPSKENPKGPRNIWG
jgi:hypothetical protein